ncbi:hypothetical protein ADUPG1_000493, partial [Aduncisulcus paluster]
IVAAACLYELDAKKWRGAYKWLYEGDIDYSSINEEGTRVEYIIPETDSTPLLSCTHIKFAHILLMCVLNDQYSLDYATACTPAQAREALSLAVRHRRIFIPLCVKASVISASKVTQGGEERYSVRKSKTHFISHLEDWVKDCGPMGPFSAQVGERLNKSVLNGYKHIRTHPQRHILAAETSKKALLALVLAILAHPALTGFLLLRTVAELPSFVKEAFPAQHNYYSNITQKLEECFDDINKDEEWDSIVYK